MRNQAVQVQNDFKRGLITEATGLNFPQNACTSCNNVEFDWLGTASRREGFNFEASATGVPLSPTTDAISTFVWRNATGDGTYNFLVMQTGLSIYFFPISSTGGPVSGTIYGPFTMPTVFSQYAGAGFLVGATRPSENTFECQYAAGFGCLVITHPNCITQTVLFTPPSTFTFAGTGPAVRDFDGQSGDTNSDTGRPATIIDEHRYNLYNQGWNSTLFDPFFAALSGVYPSNCDVWWRYKDDTGAYAPALALNFTPTTRAPQGTILYNPFIDNRYAGAGFAAGTFPYNSSQYNRPSAVAFYAGRFFLSGVFHQNFSQNIYFTGIIPPISNNTIFVGGGSISPVGAFYQREDPTDEWSSDLLPDDGGVIRVADCGQVYKLFPMQSALIVFASNGIWSITGSTGLGFTATDYTVNKLSNIRCISGTSFVDVMGSPYFWTNEGIYRVTVDISSGGLRVDSLTDRSIHDFFKSIPRANKLFARGVYNPIEFTIEWIYREAAPVTHPDDDYTFDSVLVFNTLTEGFYPWSIATGNVAVRSITLIDTGTRTDVTPNDVSFVTKYLCSYTQSSTAKMTFADKSDTRYLDWFSYDSVGQDYTSSFLTGYRVDGQAAHKFQTNYVYVYSDNSTPTQYTIQGYWNFSVNPQTKTGDYKCQFPIGLLLTEDSHSFLLEDDSGRILLDGTGTTQMQQSTIQTLTHDGLASVYAKHRVKLRGSGHAVQYLISSKKGKNFHIVGWSVFETGNTNV